MVLLIKWVAVILGLTAAGLGVRAATITIGHSIDSLTDNIARQSWWASLSAVASALTALLVAVQTLLGG